MARAMIGSGSMESEMPQKTQSIKLYNRSTGNMEIEQVYGRGWMDLFYGTRWGRWLTGRWLCRPALSRLYGVLQQHPRSRSKIAGFVEQYCIDLSACESC